MNNHWCCIFLTDHIHGTPKIVSVNTNYFHTSTKLFLECGSVVFSLRYELNSVMLFGFTFRVTSLSLIHDIFIIAETHFTLVCCILRSLCRLSVTDMLHYSWLRNTLSSFSCFCNTAFIVTEIMNSWYVIADITKVHCGLYYTLSIGHILIGWMPNTSPYLAYRKTEET